MDQLSLSSSSRAKVARADYHLKTLYDEIEGWSNSNPCRVSRECNADGSEHVFRLHFTFRPDVWRWGVLLGDALHNLRCALDHIVYSLAISNTRKDPPDDDARLAFPICSTPEIFGKPGVQKRIVSLSDSARAGVERAQPYNRVKGSWFAPLWWLAQLNDVDKHRVTPLLPVAAHPDSITINAQPGSFQGLWNRRFLVDGTPIFRLRLTQPDPNVYVDLRLTAAVVFQIEDVHPLGVVPTMRAIQRETVVVCRYLSLFL